MNILVVSSKYQPEYSGSGLRAHNTYKRLSENFNIKFKVISNSIIYKGNKKVFYDGVEIFRISPPFKIPKKKNISRFLFVILGLIWEIFYSWKYIRKNINQFSLLHTFGNTWSIGFLTWYFSIKNKPIIRELCNDTDNPLYPIQFQKYMKFIFKKNNTLMIAISKKLELVAKDFEVQNIWQRPNPVNKNKFFINYEKKYYYRKNLTSFNKKDILLSLIANFIDRKNQLFVIDVLRLLPKNFKLIMAGPLKNDNKDYFEMLLKKIKDYNLFNRVEIQTGFVENIDEYINSSDIFLFPSKAEGLGTPLLEAQICGVPVISNLIKNITDTVIIEGKGGYCLQLNAEMWADRILDALKIPENVLIENSIRVSRTCSSEIIDSEYHKRINELVVNEN